MKDYFVIFYSDQSVSAVIEEIRKFHDADEVFQEIANWVENKKLFAIYAGTCVLDLS